jgi:hypothetical protein
MRRRKDPADYPGVEYITRRFDDMQEMLRKDAGMTLKESK